MQISGTHNPTCRRHPAERRGGQCAGEGRRGKCGEIQEWGHPLEHKHDSMLQCGNIRTRNTNAPASGVVYSEWYNLSDLVRGFDFGTGIGPDDWDSFSIHFVVDL